MKHKMDKLKIKYVEIDKLVINQSNLRRYTKTIRKKLRWWIENTGFYPPIIVKPSGNKYYVLDGLLRYQILKEMGIGRIAVVPIDFKDERMERFFVLTINKLRGAENPIVRAHLISEFIDKWNMRVDELIKILPDTKRNIERLLRMVKGDTECENNEDQPIPFAVYLTKKQFEKLRTAMEIVEKKKGITKKAELVSLIADEVIEKNK